MKVLMLGWEFPPAISGGLGTACKGLVDGLALHHVDVTFVVPRLPPGAVADARVVDCEVAPTAHRAVEIESSLLPYLTAEQFERLTEQRGLSGEHGGDLMSEVARYARVVQRNAGGSYDVIHAHDWMTFPAAAAVAKKLDRPLVVHVHSCEADRAGRDTNPRIVEIEQAGFDAADRIICVSRYTAEQLRTHYAVKPERVRVVHNAVTTSDTPAGAGPLSRLDEPIVLFLGRITFQKGPNYFLEAARRVVAEEPRVKFVMAGSGDMLPAMIERTAEMGLARHVHFTGFLRGPDVDRIFDEASLYVLTSVSEPFGIAPLEALARDVPVIVSRQSGVSEVLSNVVTVDFWNVEELADRILAVLRRPELGRAQVEGGRKELENLTWERQAGLVLDVYRELTRRGLTG